MSLAKVIQDTNFKSKKIIESLEFKNNLLKEEKKLLIDELVSKKKTIVDLNEEIKHRNGSKDLTPKKSFETHK